MGHRARVFAHGALRSEMDRLFNSFVREPFGARTGPRGGSKWSPALDVADSDKEVTVRAELPGIDPKDLDVRFSAANSRSAARRKSRPRRRTKGVYHSESRYGSFTARAAARWARHRAR